MASRKSSFRLPQTHRAKRRVQPANAQKSKYLRADSFSGSQLQQGGDPADAFCDPALECLPDENVAAYHRHVRSADCCKRRSISGGQCSPTGRVQVKSSQYLPNCQTLCHTNADACRAQCSDPEEQAQCIVECDKSTCMGNREKFENACKQRCPSPRG